MGSGNGSVLTLLRDLPLSLVAVSFVDEFVFRGYLFKKLLDCKNKRLFAVVLSSVLFGLFHLINLTNTAFPFVLMQVGMTTLVGLVFCLFREKLKHFKG